MDIIKNFLNNNYFGENGAGVFVFVADVLLVLIVLILFIIEIKNKIKVSRVILTGLVLVVLYFVSLVLDMKILNGFIKYISGWIMGVYIIVFAPEIKAFLEGKKSKDRGDFVYKSQKAKEVTISTICKTIDYLSHQKVGALITFERKKSLDEIINKAIPINADITQEILTTIFTPGTACHDGGVIIKNNKIACAGAYFPLSDNYDIPTFLGTRHRAAIGVSEVYDAITIVVSEETGNISITISGNISLELTTERVATLLDSYLGAD